jgi:hypothetical protein
MWKKWQDFSRNKARVIFVFLPVYNVIVIVFLPVYNVIVILLINHLIQHYVIKVCQWLAAGLWFSPGTPVSSTNKTDSHDITVILLKVALNTINPACRYECRTHSVSSIPNVNHFISVTKHTCISHMSYSWTYLSIFILRICLFK